MANDSLIKPKCSCFSTLIFRMILYVWRLFINWIFKIRWYILLCLVFYYSRIYGIWTIVSIKCTDRQSIFLWCHTMTIDNYLVRIQVISKFCLVMICFACILYCIQMQKKKQNKKTPQYSNSLPLIRNIFQW